MHNRTTAHPCNHAPFRGACAHVQACAIAQPHRPLNRIRMHLPKGYVQFALLPLHNRLHTSIMHSYIHMNIHATLDLFSNICSFLLFQDSKANVVYDLRHNRITQSFESIDAFRDACCYSWDVGLSLESVMSVQPGGYPISHSTHSGFSVPLPGFCFSSIATRSSKFPL